MKDIDYSTIHSMNLSIRRRHRQEAWNSLQNILLVVSATFLFLAVFFWER